MNKIHILRTEQGEWYAVLKSKNGKIVWQTQSAGVTRKRTVLRAIQILREEFAIAGDDYTANILG